MTNLIVLAGVPGSGKTTWAHTLGWLKYAITPFDGKRIEENLRHNVDTIVDATNLTKDDRKLLLGLAQTHGVTPHLVVFKNTLQAVSRNAARTDDKKVPEVLMEKYMAMYYDALSEIAQEAWKSVTKIEGYTWSP